MTSILFHLPRPHLSHRQQPLWLRRALSLLGSLMIICLNTVSAVEPLTQPAVVQPQIPSSPLENINQQPAALYLDNMLQLLKPIHSQLGITVWDMTSQKTVFQYNNQSSH